MEAAAGITVPELCRTHGMSTATFYKWRAKFGGIDVPSMVRMRELEVEKRRLKTLYVEVQRTTDPLREALVKQW